MSSFAGTGRFIDPHAGVFSLHHLTLSLITLSLYHFISVSVVSFFFFSSGYTLSNVMANWNEESVCFPVIT